MPTTNSALSPVTPKSTKKKRGWFGRRRRKTDIAVAVGTTNDSYDPSDSPTRRSIAPYGLEPSPTVGQSSHDAVASAVSEWQWMGDRPVQSSELATRKTLLIAKRKQKIGLQITTHKASTAKTYLHFVGVVEPGSPAQNAGLIVGEQILRIGEKQVAPLDHHKLMSVIKQALKKGKKQGVELEIAAKPEELEEIGESNDIDSTRGVKHGTGMRRGTESLTGAYNQPHHLLTHSQQMFLPSAGVGAAISQFENLSDSSPISSLPSKSPLGWGDAVKSPSGSTRGLTPPVGHTRCFAPHTDGNIYEADVLEYAPSGRMAKVQFLETKQQMVLPTRSLKFSLSPDQVNGYATDQSDIDLDDEDDSDADILEGKLNRPSISKVTRWKPPAATAAARKVATLEEAFESDEDEIDVDQYVKFNAGRIKKIDGSKSPSPTIPSDGEMFVKRFERRRSENSLSADEFHSQPMLVNDMTGFEFSDDEDEDFVLTPRKPFLQDQVLFSGYLNKSPPIESVDTITRREWHTRWFVLSTNTLKYYKDETLKDLKGQVGTANATVLTTVTSANKEFVFAIKSSSRTYYLQAGSDTDRIAWVRAIVHVIDPAIELDENGNYPTGRDDESEGSALAKKLWSTGTKSILADVRFKRLAVEINKKVGGKHKKVGITLKEKDGLLVISKLAAGGLAAQADGGVLKPGMTIREVNGKSVEGQSKSSVMDLIKKAEKISLSVSTDDQNTDTRKTNFDSSPEAEHLDLEGLKVGDVVQVKARGKGTIRFAGYNTSTGMASIGVDLDLPLGNMDGAVRDHRYFNCDSGHGVLVPPSAVRKVSDVLPDGVVNEVDEDNGIKSPRVSTMSNIETPAPAPPPAVPKLTLDPTKAAEVQKIMDDFNDADDVYHIVTAFDRLIDLLGESRTGNLEFYATMLNQIIPVVNHKAGKVYRDIGTKLKAMSSKSWAAIPMSGVQCVIVGAGPVGLRAAVEFALHGADVTLIEMRTDFSRLNILHLWDWLCNDLTTLGCSNKELLGKSFYHVGTRRLQLILLRICCILGVKFYTGVKFTGVSKPSDGSSIYKINVEKKEGGHHDECPSAIDANLLLEAGGAAGPVVDYLNLKVKKTKVNTALGLVVHYERDPMQKDQIDEFSFSSQFKQKEFKELRSMGLDIENCVYYQGETHYFVMTPTVSSLEAFGAIKSGKGDPKDIVKNENLDYSKLRTYADRIAEYFGMRKDAKFVEGRQACQLFDFSTRSLAHEAGKILRQDNITLYAAIVGDALIEPFWPEGLGVNRGFLSILDTVYVVKQYYTNGNIKGDEENRMLQLRQELFDIQRGLHGKSKKAVLRDDFRSYGVDPSTRYLHFKQKRQKSSRSGRERRKSTSPQKSPSKSPTKSSKEKRNDLKPDVLMSAEKNSKPAHRVELSSLETAASQSAATAKAFFSVEDTDTETLQRSATWTPKNKQPFGKRAKGGSSFVAKPTPACPICGNPVYALEALVAEGVSYHKKCFKCSQCKKAVSAGNYAALEGKIYCKPHFKQLFMLKGNYNEGFGTEQHKHKWNKNDGDHEEVTGTKEVSPVRKKPGKAAMAVAAAAKLEENKSSVMLSPPKSNRWGRRKSSSSGVTASNPSDGINRTASVTSGGSIDESISGSKRTRKLSNLFTRMNNTSMAPKDDGIRRRNAPTGPSNGL